MNLPHVQIPFEDAQKFVMHFGHYRDRTLAEISRTFSGLGYLVWIKDNLRLDFHTRNAVESYLGEPSIIADLAKLKLAVR